MAKDDVRNVLGVTAAAFAHMGSVSKEEALAMSGLDPKSFDELLAKVSKAAEGVKAEPGKKHEGFYDIVSKAAEEYMDGIIK